MKSNGNGTWWKILVAIGGGLITLGIAYATIGNNTVRLDKIEPEVKLNSEHRNKDETDTAWLKEKVNNIETIQNKILEEVRK